MSLLNQFVDRVEQFLPNNSKANSRLVDFACNDPEFVLDLVWGAAPMSAPSTRSTPSCPSPSPRRLRRSVHRPTRLAWPDLGPQK
jgi:hypothetical protein